MDPLAIDCLPGTLQTRRHPPPPIERGLRELLVAPPFGEGPVPLVRRLERLFSAYRAEKMLDCAENGRYYVRR